MLGDREFRYRLPRATSGLPLYAPLLAVLFVAILVSFTHVAPGVRAIAWKPSPWWLVILTAIGAALYVVYATKCVLWRLRGCVEVTGAGVMAFDWRGRKTSLFWEHIRQLHVSGKLDKSRSGFLGITLVGGSGWTYISPDVEDAETLIDLITARAGLTVANQQPWGVIYARPEAGTEPQMVTEGTMD